MKKNPKQEESCFSSVESTGGGVADRLLVESEKILQGAEKVVYALLAFGLLTLASRIDCVTIRLHTRLGP